MPNVKVEQFTSKPYKNVDSTTLVTISDELQDGYMDESDATYRRWGLTTHISFPQTQQNDGYYIWDELKIVITVCNGVIYKITDSIGSYTEITGATLNANSPVLFAFNGTYLVMANGGSMVYTDGTTATVISDPDAPTNVTHVSFIDSYIIATNNTRFFYWSDSGSVTSWSADSYASAESNPDIISGNIVDHREINFYGPRSIEPYYNDEASPFSRIPSAITDTGVLAPYSIAKLDNTIFYIDSEKRVVKLVNRVPQILSIPVDRLISSLTDVSDAIGFGISIDNKNLYCLTFPTQDITLVYDFLLDTWYRWGYYNASTAKYERFLGQSYAYVSFWNQHLVGGRKGGKIYLMEASQNTDDGSKIRMLRRTGHINHGSNNMKLSSRLRLEFKRGYGSSSTPVVMIRYKDENSIGWSQEIQGNLGVLGDTTFEVIFQPMGMYKKRQYEMTVTDDVPFVFIRADEDVELGEL